MTRTVASRMVAPLLAAAATAALAAPAGAQGPRDGERSLRIPIPRYDGGLTPYTFELGYPLVTLIYDTLMWRDAEGVPQPWLARSVRRSRGGRTVTVTLRDDARWHDGRRVEAADVAFTLRYVDAREHPRFTPQLDDVRRVRTAGPRTVHIDLRRPALGFEDQPLSDLPILPRHLWGDLAGGRRAPAGPAVGSGPYRLVRASRDGGYVLRAVDGYFRGRARVRELRVPIIRDADMMFDALRRRRVDMVPLSLPRREARLLGGLIGINVARGDSYLGTSLVLNTRRAPFRSARARRAVSAALSLTRIARNLSPAAPATAGFVHPESRWAPRERVHRMDIDGARAQLAQLGLPTIRVLSPANDPVRQDAGRQVALALRRVGVRATHVALSASQLRRALGETGGRPAFEAAISSIPALVSHDPGYLPALFGTDPEGAPLNLSGYSSDAFDAAARRVAAAGDQRERRAAVTAELELLARDAPAIPLFFSDGAFAYRGEIYSGWAYVQGRGILDKRSFLPGEEGARRPAEVAVDGGDDDGGPSIGLFDVISLLVLLAVVALAVTALAQRRRR